MPEEPPPTRWALPNVDLLPPELAREDLVGFGGDLEPGTLLAAYRAGLFPMHVPFESDEDESGEGDLLEIGWWSPEPRGVLPLDRLVVSRSLRQSSRRLRTSIDADFAAVVEGCASARTEGQWINEDIRRAYLDLHALGWAHSIETWQGDVLVGGLYGVSIGGLFAGESMFHRATDASKVALMRLVDELGSDGIERLLDVQWVTPHLASLGAVEVSRSEYQRRLAAALVQPAPAAWRSP
ncbi:MAG: leucyl/phenylalanyl-tRNA--protein transferase [Actinomycetes bacterium]